MSESATKEVSGGDEWLKELEKLHEADKAVQDAAAAQVQLAEQRKQRAAQLMQDCRAHELLRQVQKALLGGKGVLRFYTNSGGYDQAVALLWQGPISQAEKPVKDEKADGLLLVGTREGQLWVNEMPVAAPTAPALKQALLEACRELVASASGMKTP
ncbi:MAG: hypothetical protein KA314_15875 [Chloroflexi bacterium]|nr:hypothetical protein [Chloroflexota bacterium]MBP8057314.1 hypothetical protein [Chloroflexota bacterium]